jgi:hypothetical protein
LQADIIITSLLRPGWVRGRREGGEEGGREKEKEGEGGRGRGKGRILLDEGEKE